jgi:hypothetical protein
MSVMRPSEFCETAAQWGSMMTAGDPGSCMYGFDKQGLLQSEEHRQECLDYIQSVCRPIAATNESKGESKEENSLQLDDLVAYVQQAPIAGSTPILDEFTKAYIEAALFSTNDESDEAGGDPLDDNYGVEHIDSETLASIVADCALFQEYYKEWMTEDFCTYSRCSALEYAGHDFWLTRCGHGAGFWDGDWKEPAETILTEGAKSFGDFYLEVGDDGKIHGHSDNSKPEKFILPSVSTP